MYRLTQFIKRYPEGMLISSVLLPALVVQWLPHKLMALNFFFLPTIAASYCFGRRIAGVTALLSVLAIAIYAVADPSGFLYESTPLTIGFDLAIWGSFLGLSAVIVGTLSDQRHTKMKELKQAYFGLLEIMGKYFESADDYTQSHSVRVAHLSTAIAEEMELSEEAIEAVRAGALLHDVAKTETVELIKRTSSFTDADRGSKAKYRIRGVNLVECVGSVLKEAVPIVLYYHHYFDGSKPGGGRQGGEIPLGARIVAVADSFDAMVTEPSNGGRNISEAFAELQRRSGTEFDPEVVTAFSRLYETGDDLDLELYALATDALDMLDGKADLSRVNSIEPDPSSSRIGCV